MRLFLGIDLPVTEKQKLYKQIEPLMRKYPSFDWVDPHLYHATLQFFGEVDDVTGLTDVMERVTFDKKSFYLYGLDLGMFSSLHQLTLYLHFQRQKAIDDIVDDVEALYPAFVKQRSFIFHTTIAKAKASSKQQYFHLKKRLREIHIDISFPVDNLILFGSTRDNEGRKYIELKRFPLL